MKKILLFFVYLFKGLFKSSLGRIIIFLSIVALLFWLSGPNDNEDKNSHSTKTYNYIEAYTFAEGFVKKQLKAPGTAKFPRPIEYKSHVTSIGKNKFLIISWVDAQNSFGALLRNNFSCEIEFVEGSVKCTNMIID